jgi:hypothetical protein
MPATINGVEQTDPVGTWPLAAAPDDGVSLPAAVAYMVEQQIGTIDNTTGVPTLGGVIGDVGNVSIALRLEEIQAEVEEIEHHFHTKARWFGLSGAVTATNWGDDTITPFVATSGNGTWGGATDADIARVLGSADTPIISGQLFFDMDSILIIAATQTSVYKLRFLWGTGTWAEAVAAGQYTETMAIVISAASKNTKENIRMPRLRAGMDQVWCQVWNATDDATISFFVGVHGYDR